MSKVIISTSSTEKKLSDNEKAELEKLKKQKYALEIKIEKIKQKIAIIKGRPVVYEKTLWERKQKPLKRYTKEKL